MSRFSRLLAGYLALTERNAPGDPLPSVSMWTSEAPDDREAERATAARARTPASITVLPWTIATDAYEAEGRSIDLVIFGWVLSIGTARIVRRFVTPVSPIGSGDQG